jgi:hypothetical protein
MHMTTIFMNRLTRMVLCYTCLNTCPNFLTRCFWSSSSDLHPSQAALVLFVVSTKHKETYKTGKAKTAKHITPIIVKFYKQYAKTGLVATIKRTQETPKKLSYRYIECFIYKREIKIVLD